MQNDLLRKTLVLGVIVLFTGMAVSPSTGFNGVEQSNIPITNGKTLYVGGSGLNNYTRIQDAVDDASDGDTVFVYDDSSPYYENVVVNKSIDLIGEDRDTTVIDGNLSGSVVYISADWVNISGFTLRNASDWSSDAGIEIGSNHCTIDGNNIISNNSQGLYLSNSNNSIISGNYFSQNHYSIRLRGSSYNTISGNTIAYNYCGIVAQSHSSFNIISDNIFWNVEEYPIYIGLYCNNSIIINNSLSHCKCGIYTLLSSHNNFLGNSINSCDIGLYLTGSMSIVYGNWMMLCASYGIFSRQRYVTISCNSISNSGHGIYLHEYSNNYSIIDNTITSNGGHGVYLKGSSSHAVSNNTITSNGGHGVYLKGSSSHAVSNNTITSNGGHGIFLNSSCNNNTIIYNNVNSNNGYGIRIENVTNPSNNNSIYHNYIINNTFSGYDNCDNNAWDNGYPSGGNYWSDYNGIDDYRGPNQNISGGDGIGDTPKNITGGSNRDWYPLMYPWGEQPPVANFTYSIIDDGGLSFNGSSSYDRDGIVLLYEWDFDDGSTGQGVVVSHGYNESGTYDVTLTVTDDDGYQGFYTRSIDAEKNYPPSAPSIDGPTKGKAGKSYFYDFTSEDPELADVSYYIEWGDGKVKPWSDFLPSGETYRTSHGWAKGTYTIRAKTKDIYGAESDWGTLEVTMPKNKVTYHSLLIRLLERFPNMFPMLRHLIEL